MLLSSAFVHGLRVAVLICGIVWLSNPVQAQAPSTPISSAPSEEGRPILRRGNGPSTSKADPVPSTVTVATHLAPTGPIVAPGLALPSTGRVWALDTFEGQPELVHLMYFQTNVDRHAASNFAKVNLAPFIAKVKMTVELNGAKSTVRLHQPTPAIFVRYISHDNEDAALDPSAPDTHAELTLVRLEVHGDKRIVNTIAFTQVTGNASRSQNGIEVIKEPFADSPWIKITPAHPLPPGEYGLVALANRQNLIPTQVFDFAIDLGAPRNSNIVLPQK